jgi:hypothetical protein
MYNCTVCCATRIEQQRDMHRTSFKGEKAIPGLSSETTHPRGIKSHMHQSFLGYTLSAYMRTRDFIVMA